jgi:sugar lactone lactonase YvrE
VLTSDGSFLEQWRAGFFGPRGIAVAADGRVLVSDTGGSRIVVLDPEGKELAAWGEPGSGPQALDGPVGLAVDAEGRVFVADNGNGRMQVFDRGGTLVASFPVEGWRNEPYSEPGLALDGSGSVWASVPLAGEVRLYSADGKVLRRFRTGTPPGLSLGRPTGLAFRARDRHLLVADLDRGLVTIPVGAGP